MGSPATEETLNRSVGRGLLFGAGFGCTYLLVILLLGGSSGAGLAILGGLGGAAVGAVSGCIIAVLTFGIGRLTRVRRRHAVREGEFAVRSGELSGGPASESPGPRHSLPIMSVGRQRPSAICVV